MVDKLPFGSGLRGSAILAECSGTRKSDGRGVKAEMNGK